MGITDDDRDETRVLLRNAAAIAQEFGPQILAHANGPREAIVSMAIIMATISRVTDVSMHSLIGVVMEVYKHSIVMEHDDEADE